MAIQSKSSCYGDFSPLIDLHIDGMLDDPGEEHLRLHLEECSDCREFVEARRGLRHRLSLAVSAAPDSLRNRIVNLAFAESPPFVDLRLMNVGSR